MAASRPTVTVYQHDQPAQKATTLVAPSVFTTPLRPDLVRYIHTNMAKNHRQAYANKYESGYQYSATSWGTGHAVSRIPRISGSGTQDVAKNHRQAYANKYESGYQYLFA